MSPDESRQQRDRGLPEREIPRSGRDPATHKERPDDPHEIPLETREGQGATRDTYPLSSSEPSSAGHRGAGVRGESEGAAGLADRENRYASQRRRRDRGA